jgi:hypothetical protein
MILEQCGVCNNFQIVDILQARQNKLRTPGPQDALLILPFQFYRPASFLIGKH